MEKFKMKERGRWRLWSESSEHQPSERMERCTLLIYIAGGLPLAKKKKVIM